jgi:hypothetical protein
VGKLLTRARAREHLSLLLWWLLFLICSAEAFFQSGDRAVIWLVGGLVCILGIERNWPVR